MYVKPKKHLGQHFLTDMSIAQRIASSVKAESTPLSLEVGPGTGVLTKYLLERGDLNLFAAEVDSESVDYLNLHYPSLTPQLIYGDFLKFNLEEMFNGEMVNVVGNFPYNISSQIYFKILEYKDLVPESVGMIQREVALRLASPPGKKDYGILSVLLQAYYDIEYLFTVEPGVFNPPPKVRSAVIRLTRNNTKRLDCDEILFKRVVKETFLHRRKMIRNTVGGAFGITNIDHPFFTMRPEQLSVNQFVELTNLIDNLRK